MPGKYTPKKLPFSKAVRKGRQTTVKLKKLAASIGKSTRPTIFPHAKKKPW